MQGTARIALLVLVTALLSITFVQEAGALAPLVVIDPGHGGPYSNANANGLKEKNVNLAIALELRRQLWARGYRVGMTRTTDRAVTLSDIPTWNWSSTVSRWSYQRDLHRGLYGGIPKDDLQARANVANRMGADVFISIHNNGSASRAARGTETFASPRDPLGITLSRMVHKRIVYRTGLRDRGAKTTDFYVCRWSNMPAILVEGGFITNTSDAWKLRQYTFRRKMAIAIAESVHTWFRSRPYTKVVPEISAPSAMAAAANLSRSEYQTGAPVAVLARLDRWADAPSVAGLSARLGGPLLWSYSTLSSINASELARLAPEKVVLVGLTGSFSESFTADVGRASGIPTSAVEVIEAPRRAELAASIAASMAPLPAKHVIFADEGDVQSVLAAIGPATRHRIPVLLTRGGALTPGARAFMDTFGSQITLTVLMGPPYKTPASLIPTDSASVRIDGPNIAAKAAAVNARYYRMSAWGSMPVIAADPAYGPGYLTAARKAYGTSLILAPVSARVLPDETRLWQTNRRAQIGSFTIFDARADIPTLMGHMLKKADR